jgi:hydrogenase nickel incorporation protein HypA/HybF
MATNSGKIGSMHELPVSQNILDICIKHAEDANATKITNINIVIGQFASIVDDSLCFYWDIIAKNTIASDSALNFKRITAKFECRECKTIFDWQDVQGECPNCNSPKVHLIAGNEFFVESIEVE